LDKQRKDGRHKGETLAAKLQQTNKKNAIDSFPSFFPQLRSPSKEGLLNSKTTTKTYFFFGI
jgi:hypothetical protein